MATNTIGLGQAESDWRWWKPNGIANVAMGDMPVLHTVWGGVLVERQVPTRKGVVRKAAPYQRPQTKVSKPKWVAKPVSDEDQIDMAEMEELFNEV